jgi:DUF1365 family protein
MTSLAAHSALYEGTVRHRRHAERPQEFSYPVSLAYLDLDELGSALDGRLVARGPGLLRYRRADYLGDARVPLDEAVRALVAVRLGRTPTGPVRLLTQPRTLGHAFNPVSFYYVFDDGDGDGRLDAVVAEVTNTPWGERHSYVLDARAGGSAPVMKQKFAKVFHVSPFMGLDHEYAWSLSTPGPALSVNIDSRTTADGPGGPADTHAFDATLSLRRVPLDGPGLNRLLARFPLQTLVTGIRIYAHAVRLKTKGAPYFAHPEGHKPPFLTMPRHAKKTDPR